MLNDNLELSRLYARAGFAWHLPEMHHDWMTSTLHAYADHFARFLENARRGRDARLIKEGESSPWQKS